MKCVRDYPFGQSDLICRINTFIASLNIILNNFYRPYDGGREEALERR